MKKITSKFAMLLATAGVVPLLAYGGVSILSLREGTRQSVVAGNTNVAKRAADQIWLYMETNVKVLETLATNLQSTDLTLHQQDRILKDYVLDFPEFSEITRFDAAGDVVATSRIGEPGLRPGREGEGIGENVFLSAITIDDALLPTGVISVRLRRLNESAGWLQGELRLEELWRMVDEIRVGQRGFALVAAREDQLIAHGDPNQKPRVARGDTLESHPLVRRLKADDQPESAAEELFSPEVGEQILVAAAPIRQLGWTVLVEQPTSEAFSVANQLTLQLFFIIGAALLVTVLVGYWWGRQFIQPIFALMRGTQAVSEGRLDERVAITSNDEFRRLGDAFNGMADRLVELQEDVKRKERQATFGRVAVGLVHDLSHPIQNIGNSCRLMMKVWEDLEYRETFRRTVEREFATAKRVLEDLRHLARPAPLERVALDVNRTVLDVVESVKAQADGAGIALTCTPAAETLFMEGDPFALGRVYRNLITNAIQATESGGRVIVTTLRRGRQAEIAIADTGCGIAAERLPFIFDDFVTTKRRGLGLGLAISKKIVEQIGGTIEVSSELDRGTTFTIRFPTIEHATADADTAKSAAA